MKSVERKHVFISYSRSDGQEWAAEISSFLSVIDNEFWQDIHDMKGEHDNLTEIRNAIEKSEHVVVVITKSALESEWVKKEWEYALENGINVCPVIVNDNCIDALSGWQKDRYCYYFNRESDRSRLIDVAKGSGKRERLCKYIPEMPVKYVPREFIEKIKYRLIDKYGNDLKTTFALVGAGGYGKTVAAKALCIDEDIKLVYSGRIIPVVIGNDLSFSSKSILEGKIIGIIEDIIFKLKGERYKFSCIETASNELAVILSSIGNVLLFIDDVWRESDLRYFLRISGNCSIIITTRIKNCLPSDIEKYEVGKFDDGEAFKLISDKLPFENSSDEERVLRRLSHKLFGWAQLIAIANRWLLKKYEKDVSVKEAVSSFNRLLDEKGYQYFDPRNEIDRDRNLSACIEASIEFLSDENKQRFYELSIFPEDEDIPFSIIFLLWEKTGVMDEDDSLELCEYFYDSSLFDSFSAKERLIRIHDNILKYLKGKITKDRRYEVNKMFVDALCEKYPNGFSSVQVFEKYIWRNLIRHLSECKKNETIESVLTDYQWIKKKLDATNCVDLYNSYFVSEHGLLADRIAKAIGLSMNTICENSAMLSGQLWGRLGYYKEIKCFLSDLLSDLNKRALLLMYPSLTPPCLQKMKLQGFKDGESVVSVGYYDNDSSVMARSDLAQQIFWKSNTGEVIEKIDLSLAKDQIVCYSKDNTIYIAKNAENILSVFSVFDQKTIFIKDLSNYHDYSSVLSGDKKRVMLLLDFRVVLIYDIETHKLIGSYTSLENILEVCFSNSGCGCFVLLKTGFLIYFESNDFNNGIRFGVSDKEIIKFIISSDDKIVFGVFDDGELFVWDMPYQNSYRTFRAEKLSEVSNLAFSLQLSRLIASDITGKICVWDIKTLLLYAYYCDHEYNINSISVSLSGDMLVSASLDNTACVYDLKKDKIYQVYKGHEGEVNDARFSNDQKYIITGSDDSTVRLWYVEPVALPSRYLSFHDKRVNDIDISINDDYLISASDDFIVKLWDLKTGEVVGNTYKADSPVIRAIFSKDSRYVAALLADGSLDVIKVSINPVSLLKMKFTDNEKKVSPVLISFSPNRKILLLLAPII